MLVESVDDEAAPRAAPRTRARRSTAPRTLTDGAVTPIGDLVPAVVVGTDGVDLVARPAGAAR